MKFNNRFKSKFNNKKTIIDGIKFASQKEAAHYQKLKLMESAHLITNLSLQYTFKFEYMGKTLFRYIADFVYDDILGKQHVIDVKGFRTPIYRLKKKLVEAFKNIIIEEV